MSHDFSQEINIGYETIHNFSKATPTKDKFAICQNEMDLMSIIDTWEHSGQGDGGAVDKGGDDEYDREGSGSVNNSESISGKTLLENAPQGIMYQTYVHSTQHVSFLHPIASFIIIVFLIIIIIMLLLLLE